MKPSYTAYWQIVLKCLTKLFDVSPQKARTLISDYRHRILSTPEGLRRDIIYHLEPWQLAQRLAGAGDRKLTRVEQSWYEKTVSASTAEAAIVGTEDEVREFQKA